MSKSAAQHQFVAERQHEVLDADQKWKGYELADGSNFKVFLVYSLTEVHVSTWYGYDFTRVDVMPVEAARTLWKIYRGKKWSQESRGNGLFGVGYIGLATVKQGRGKYTK